MILKYYDTGLAAFDALMKDEIEMASAVADFVFAGQVIEQKQVQTIACIDKNEYAYILGRKDHGIQTTSDLKGKRVGVMHGTFLEFTLGRFLYLSGLSADDIILVSLSGNPQSADAITSGTVDAVITVPPYVNQVQEKLGDKLVVWSAQKGQPLFSLQICKKEWIRQNPTKVNNVLKALVQSEKYIIEHPKESKTIIKNDLNLSDSDVEALWQRNQFSLSLDISIVTSMNDEARWLIDNSLTTEKTVPNFKDFIYIDGLKTVKPEAVNIIK